MDSDDAQPPRCAGYQEDPVALHDGIPVAKDADPSVLDTLAAAYAAAGRRGDAIEAARRALALAEAGDQAALARTIRERLLGLGAGASAP